ncbi:MAG: hypothetical protein PSN44_06295 [Gammaproteobacteria bacterium]|nr:hypothetical protein [Gammaproteobacteria bacterium]
MAKNSNDVKIDDLHIDALEHINKLEKIIDELKNLGNHSLNNNNALLNVQEHLAMLSER